MRDAISLCLLIASSWLVVSCDSCRGQAAQELTQLVPVVVDASTAPAVHLVRSTAKHPYSPDYPELLIGEGAIWLNGAMVVELDHGEVDAGPGELLIVPLRDALSQEAPRALTVTPSPHTRYRLFSQVLYTAATAGVTRYQFPVTDEASRKHAILIEAPNPSIEPAQPEPGDAGAASRPLNLMVRITDDGLGLSSSLDSLPGVSEGTDDLRIPLVDNWRSHTSDEELGLRTERGLAPPARAYDVTALRGRLLEIRSRYSSERRVVIAAEENVDWETIVATIDASRADDGDLLFPEILFSGAI